MLTVLFPRAKRPTLGVNHPPQFSAKADERVELNLYSPALPSWWVRLGWTLCFHCHHVDVT